MQNATLDLLIQKIQDKEAIIAVVGLGYVGLPVAVSFATVGFKVIGIDVKPDRVEKIQRGINPIEGKEPGLDALLSETIKSAHFSATTNYSALAEADVITINVETPTDINNIPRYAALRAATDSIAQNMKDGALVIIESTVAPGTCNQVVRPILETYAGQRSVTFHLGACPERVMPGRLLANLQNLSRVCGSDNPAVAEVMVLLYRSFVKAELDTSNLVTAELTKTAENTYRDINIAFANELALICQSVGADFLEVRRLVNKSPGRNVLLAGSGVGGHCIPKDPWLLAYSAGNAVDLKVIPAARHLNDSMPERMAKMAEDLLSSQGINIKDAVVAILGYSYLEESDDIRNSPSEKLSEILKPCVAELRIQDPYVPGFQTELEKVLSGVDIAVVMVSHEAYRHLDLLKLKTIFRTPLILDGRRAIDYKLAEEAGFIYTAIGLGKQGSNVNV